MEYEVEARSMISELEAIKDDNHSNDLDEYQRGVYDTLVWLMQDGPQPNVEDE